MFSITALSTMRMCVGASLLVIPEYTATAFLLPYATPAALPGRMTGIRDFILGALLHVNARSNRASPQAVESNSSTGNSPLLHDGVKNSLAGKYSNDEIRRYLMANVVVDAVDVLSALWGYAEGSLPFEGLMTLGGGAVLFVVLGLYSYVKLPAQT